MAPPPGTLRVGRYFLALFSLMVLLYLLVFLPGEQHTPKLGLDLVGGQQVIFQARTTNGQTPTSSSMEQAKQIIEERVNGNGVTEATVVIQGNDQLIVSIPGGTRTDVQKLGAAAVLNFRGVVAPAAPVGCRQTPAAGSTATTGGSPTTGATASGSGSAAPSPSSSASTKAAANGAGERPLNAPSATAVARASSTATARASNAATPTSAGSATAADSGSGTAAGSGSGTATGSGAAATPSASSTAVPECSFTSVSELKKVIKLPDPSGVYKTNGVASTLYQQIQAALSGYRCDSSSSAPDPKNDYYIACDDSGLAYLLGPVVVPGNQIDTATAVAPNLSGGGGTSVWSVSLSLKGSGNDAWASYTGSHNIGSTTNTAGSVTACGTTTPCADYVAFTLDGKVISAPVNESAINGQATQITGGFDQTSANQLSDQLKFGALPLSFTAQQAQTVSATLGTSQLEAGLLAGGIGLILVVLYSLIYYRALGLVTIASLLVSGALTYAMLVVLGKQIGFTLSLAGIAGFIVAVGITADSFVVFFERIKDEVHEGRSVRVAVPRAWVRARRTILSADTVSFLAAAILYFFAAGDVRGFAFTLGLSTILDLVVVFLFTHPLVSLLSRSRAFGSARFTGLDSVRVGGIAAPSDADELPVRRTGPAAKRARGGTAVLDKATSPTTRTRREAATEDGLSSGDLLGDDPVTEDFDGATPGGVTGRSTRSDASAVDDDPDDVEDDPAENERATFDSPSQPRSAAATGGSAAERAAARRARMRAQRDADGKDER